MNHTSLRGHWATFGCNKPRATTSSLFAICWALGKDLLFLDSAQQQPPVCSSGQGWALWHSCGLLSRTQGKWQEKEQKELKAPTRATLQPSLPPDFLLCEPRNSFTPTWLGFCYLRVKVIWWIQHSTKDTFLGWGPSETLSEPTSRNCLPHIALASFEKCQSWLWFWTCAQPLWAGSLGHSLCFASHSLPQRDL